MDILHSREGVAALTALGIGGFTLLALALLLWSLVWKGFALWHAARNYQRNWFIALLILNTAGILDIIYLVWFRSDKRPGVTQSLFNNPTPDPDAAESEEEVAQTPGA